MNLENVVDKAKDQMINTGLNPEDHIAQVAGQTKVSRGKGPNGKERFQIKEIKDYMLDKRAAYTIAENADPSKPTVAFAKEYFLQSTAKAEIIEKRLKDKEYIENRDALKLANKEFTEKLLQHSVKENELGVAHNAFDESLYNMSTQEMKDKYGKTNRPKADFLGSEMCNAEKFAKNLSSSAIEVQNAQGLNECSDVITDTNSEIRDLIKRKTGKNPEELITGEDVKKVEKNYNSKTKKLMEKLEKEGKLDGLL